MATIGTSGTRLGNLQAVAVGSPKSDWVVANTDLETADTAGLLKPYLITRSEFAWVPVPFGCKLVRARARQLATASAVTTSPVIRLVAAWGRAGETTTPFSGTPGDSNYAQFGRLDYPSTTTYPSDDNATGLTLTLATSNLMEDATYEYSDPTPWYDCYLADYVGMLVETAANVANATVAGLLQFG